MICRPTCLNSLPISSATWGNADAQVEAKDHALRHSEKINQKLTYELALLKRHAFGKRSGQLNVLQISLLDEVMDADISAIETELEDLATSAMPRATKQKPRRQP